MSLGKSAALFSLSQTLLCVDVVEHGGSMEVAKFGSKYISDAVVWVHR